MVKPIRLILVTGTPRCGSTAVGRYLSLGTGVRPLYEPFNFYAGMIEVNQYFEIPGTQSFSYAQMDDCVAKLQSLNLNLKPGIFPKNKGWSRLLKSILGGRSKLYYRLCKLDPYLHTVIWKDPLACFTADYVSKHYPIDVIVPYRNPWAVASSFKRLNWSFNLEDIQSRLQEVGLDLNTSTKKTLNVHPSVMNGSLLWHAIHLILTRWKQQNQKILFVNLDKIIEAPLLTYRMIYDVLSLSYSVSIENKIKRSYGKIFMRSQPQTNRPHDWNRNIQDINQYWAHSLTQPEIEYVHHLNNDLWQKLQPECITQSISLK
jgi:hypothetical protein